jgi:hypothetical protein
MSAPAISQELIQAFTNPKTILHTSKSLFQASEHNSANLVVAIELLDHFIQLVKKSTAQSIQSFRPVELDNGHLSLCKRV